MVKNHSIIRNILLFFQEIFSGFLLTVIILIFSISDAALVFSGNTLPYLAYGIGLMVMSTAVVTCIISMFTSYKPMISATQETTVIILAIVGASISNKLHIEGLPEQIFPTFFTFIILSSVVTGLFLIFLGIFKLGNFARFIPYHVLGGFLAATGVLIMLASWSVITGHSFSIYQILDYLEIDSLILWGPAILTGVCFFLLSKIIKIPLLIPALIVFVIILFYLIINLLGFSTQEVMDKHMLLGPFPEGNMWKFPKMSDIHNANWKLIWDEVGNLVSLAVLTPLALLLNATGIEAEAKVDINLDDELKYAGIANVLAPALGGGVISYQSIFASDVNSKLGTKTRIVSIVIAITSGLLLIYSMNLVGLIPKFVIAGIIFFLGLSLSINWLVILRKLFTIDEYMVMVLIAITIVMFGFLQGLALGTTISLIIFVVNYSRMKVIKHTLEGSYTHSNVERGEEQRKTLIEKGRLIQLMKLHGFLFFGNAHDFFVEVMSKLNNAQGEELYLIIEFKEVSGFDSSSINSFIKLYHNIIQTNSVLVFTEMPQTIYEPLSKHLPLGEESDHLKFFDDIDHALEWCENDLLRKSKADDSKEHGLIDYLKELTDNQEHIELVISNLQELEVDKDYTLVKQGEESDDLFFLDSGKVEVILEMKSGSNIRLKTIGPGTVIGEIGLYLNIPRTATIITKEPCKLYRLSKEKLEDLQHNDPISSAYINQLIIRQLASRLIYANHQIQGLLKPNIE